MKKVAILFALTLTPVAWGGTRQQLADAARPRLTSVARAETLMIWYQRMSDFVDRAPDVKWTSKDAEWQKAHEEIMQLVLRTVRELQDTPEARERMSKPFFTDLTEAEAAAVRELAADQRKALDDYADDVALRVHIAEQNPKVGILSKEMHEIIAPLEKSLGLDQVHDVPHVNLPAATLDHYKQARMFGVEFLRTAIDGQLQLWFFDHREALSKIVLNHTPAHRKAH
jgi:hypothetical protein